MSTLTQALAPKSDQLNADDLMTGPRTIKITGARIGKDDRQLRITLSYEGDGGKPFKPCKTMARAMVLVWGVTDENFEQQLVGKSIRVYRDPEVKFGDQGAVGGIRISHMSHIDSPKTIKLTVSQGKKANFTFQPLPRSVEGGEYALADAEADLRAAFDLDELRAIWSRKGMAPFREQLQPLLDERKAALSPATQSDPATPHGEATGPANTEDEQSASSEGRSDADFGDGHDGTVTLESAIARLDDTEYPKLVMERFKEDEPHLCDEDAATLRRHYEQRLRVLRGAA